MSSRLPAVGTAIDLMVGGTVVAARCDGARGRDVTLVVRAARTAIDPNVVLRWRGLRGVSTARAEVVTVDPVPGRTSVRWHVRLVGAIEVVQRRHTARAFGAGPVALTPSNSRLAAVHDGTLLDISERGLRCRIENPTLRQHDPVLVHVGLGEHVLEMRGEVIRVTRASDGFAEVAVGYTPAEAEGARIRRYVYLQQVRMRRAGLV
jgi:hypothetical protein